MNLTADVPEIKKLIGEFGKIGKQPQPDCQIFNQDGINLFRNENKNKKISPGIFMK